MCFLYDGTGDIFFGDIKKYSCTCVDMYDIIDFLKEKRNNSDSRHCRKRSDMFAFRHCAAVVPATQRMCKLSCDATHHRI